MNKSHGIVRLMCCRCSRKKSWIEAMEVKLDGYRIKTGYRSCVVVTIIDDLDSKGRIVFNNRLRL